MRSILPSGKRNIERQPRLSRQLRMEFLEDRMVLSGPQVADVNICSTDWAPDFVEYLETSNLGTDGYSIPVGSSAQLQTLPWTNLNQIRVTFSEDVDVQMADLSVSGVNVTAYVFSDFSYDANTYTAIWTLPDPIEKDKLLLDLDADGIDPVQDLVENALDGEWTNSSNTYNSGNGTAGGDFEFRFNVLPGDANASASVTIIDPMLGNLKKGKVPGDAGYGIRYDVDGSAEITTADCNAMYYNLGDLLPVGDPEGMGNDAPTTTGFDDMMVARNAVDVVLSLWDAFDDAEDNDDELSYSVVENTNPDLFDSVSIDDQTGELTLDFAPSISGLSVITIRAVDLGGLIADTQFLVRMNDAPVISNFYGLDLGGDTWRFQGTVTDVDDDVEGMQVVLGGILDGYDLTATVLSNGTFSVTASLPDLISGFATAQTEDWWGAASNVADTYVLVS
ncbi:MAG: hypothetical protein NTW96_26165 [Planctomycetia bacterium]|nr:hypothetical protein [Planctomycetia bacterium]